MDWEVKLWFEWRFPADGCSEVRTELWCLRVDAPEVVFYLISPLYLFRCTMLFGNVAEDAICYASLSGRFAAY